MESYFGSESSHKKRLAAWTIGGGLALFFVLAMAALFAKSAAVQTMASGGTAEAALGPLTLLQIHKMALEGGGFQLEFAFKPGLIGLLVLCMLGAVLASVAWQRFCSTRKPRLH